MGLEIFVMWSGFVVVDLKVFTTVWKIKKKKKII